MAIEVIAWHIWPALIPRGNSQFEGPVGREWEKIRIVSTYTFLDFYCSKNKSNLRPRSMRSVREATIITLNFHCFLLNLADYMCASI